MAMEAWELNVGLTCGSKRVNAQRKFYRKPRHAEKRCHAGSAKLAKNPMRGALHDVGSRST
jgi:hypothetical protein